MKGRWNPDTLICQGQSPCCDRASGRSLEYRKKIIISSTVDGRWNYLPTTEYLYKVCVQLLQYHPGLADEPLTMVRFPYQYWLVCWSLLLELWENNIHGPEILGQDIVKVPQSMCARDSDEFLVYLCHDTAILPQHNPFYRLVTCIPETLCHQRVCTGMFRLLDPSDNILP